MTLLLTSFREARLLDMPKWSGARWAPDFAKDWPVAEWAKPVDNGEYIRPRLFVGEPDPLRAYYEAMYALYDTRHDQIMGDLEWTAGRDLAICCWCPFTKAARRQMDQFDTFVCHMGALAKWLGDHHMKWAFGEQHRTAIARVNK